MLLRTLGASLLGNLLRGWGIYKAEKSKGAMATSQGRRIIRASEGIVRAEYESKKGRKNNKVDF